MSEIEFSGGEKRMEAFSKLKCFLSNPGMFSLVVVGSRGSGKNFAIEKAFKSLKVTMEKNSTKKLCLEELNFISSLDFPNNKSEIDKLFQSHLNQTIAIDDYENLNNNQKYFLLEALSTVNGKFGITEKVEIRILFSSSQKIEYLRNQQDAISLLMWDRISQLIIELPSFKDEGTNIITDFKNTWGKMAFEKIEKYKNLAEYPSFFKLDNFLQSNKADFVGGFRDLDKIACLYFNYRIFHYGNKRKIENEIEELVFKNVKSDFLGKTQMMFEEETINHIFDFNEVRPSDETRKHPTLDDFNNQFRIQFRMWLLEKHKTLSKAADNLSCSIHTLKNYKEGMATKFSRLSADKKNN